MTENLHLVLLLQSAPSPAVRQIARAVAERTRNILSGDVKVEMATNETLRAFLAPEPKRRRR